MLHRSRRATTEATKLIEETTALLMGRAMSFYQVRKRQPPAWVHLNWIAHGQASEIIERARSETGLNRPSGTWAWATSTFARELLVSSKGDLFTVEQLQRDCLVPIELALMRGGREDVHPEQVVALGIPHLLSHPSVRSGE
jgi:hypothetical protein